jgi:transposase
VLSLAFSTIFNSTTFSSRRRRLHLAKPSGAGPQVSAISLASAAPPAPVDLKALHAKIGELALENDFLEGALTKAGLLSAKR